MLREKNKATCLRFFKIFLELNNYLYEIKIKWIPKKMRNLFLLKSKNRHPACAKREGMCKCKGNYIRETKRNVESRE